MFTELKACYSPMDLVFVITLFCLTLTALGAFVILMIHLVKGALEEAEDIKKRNQSP